MELVDIIIPALTSQLLNLPVCMVWIGGVVLAVVYRRRNPRVSTLTFIAIVILAFISLTGAIVSMLIPYLAFEQNVNINEMQGMLLAFNCLIGIISALAWALLLAAIFGWPLAKENEGDST